MKRRSTFAVLFYINRTKIRKDGLCQLLCKISIDAESAQIGTKVAIDPAIWNPTTGRADGRSRNANEVNRAIDALTEEIKAHYKRINLSLGFVTAELVKNAVKDIGQKPLTLLALFREHNEEFDLFLRTNCRLQQKSVHEHLYRLKKMTVRAVNQGTLRRDPYATLHPELPKRRSRHLKLDELKRLLAEQVADPELRRARDWFIFSTFTGLAYADLKQLSERHITQDTEGVRWIHIRRQKTGTESVVRLLDIPLRIIEKYRTERTDERLLPICSYRKLQKLIPRLGEVYGIENLTFHRARHNFGTHITLSLGVPIETVSRMMGHRRLMTTQIYAHVTDKKVDEDTKQLRELSASRELELYEEPIRN